MLQYHSAGVCVGGSRGGDQAAAEPQEDTGQAGQEGEQGGGEAPAGHDGDRGGGPGPGAARSVGDMKLGNENEFIDWSKLEEASIFIQHPE